MRRLARDVGAIAVLAAERLAQRVQERREERAVATPWRCARAVRRNATWKAAAVGAVAAIPGGPLLTVVASAGEAGLLAHLEASAAAEIRAMVFGVDGIDLLAPRGGEPWRAMFRAGVQKAMRVAAEQAGLRLGRAAVKELGMALPRLGARAVLGVAAPLASAAWSAAWNALDMHRRLTPAVRAAEAEALAAHLRRLPPSSDASDLAQASWPGAVVALA